MNAQLTGDWDRLHHAYRLAVALYDANDAFGYTKAINNEHDRLRYDLDQKYGNWRKAPAVDQAAVRASLQRCNDASERSLDLYVNPADRAAIALMLTPAPDVDAVHIKIAIAAKHELDNTTGMPREPMDIIIEDVRRLGGEVAA